MPITATTETLLLECAQLINEFGPESPEVDAFIAAHEDSREFVDLARFSIKVKQALLAEGEGRNVQLDRYSPARSCPLRAE